VKKIINHIQKNAAADATSLPTQVCDGKGKAEADFHGPGEHIDEKIHLGAVVFLQQDAIGFPQDVPGPKFFVCRHAISSFSVEYTVGSTPQGLPENFNLSQETP
jgi:hypothetical protein